MTHLFIATVLALIPFKMLISKITLILLLLFQGFPFQVGYCETTELNNCTVQYTLYLVASSEKERQDWIKVLRKSEWNDSCDVYKTAHFGFKN